MILAVLHEIEQDDRLWRRQAKTPAQRRDQKQSLAHDMGYATETKEMDPEASLEVSKADDLDSVNAPKEVGGRITGKPTPGFY